MTYRDATGPDDPATLYIHDAVRRYPDRLIGYVRINPNAPVLWMPWIRRWVISR